METLFQDVRYGLRALKRNLSLTAVVSITIALGVGANTAAFNVVNGFLIRPLPVPAPEQIVALAIQSKVWSEVQLALYSQRGRHDHAI